MENLTESFAPDVVNSLMAVRTEIGNADHFWLSEMESMKDFSQIEKGFVAKLFGFERQYQNVRGIKYRRVTTAA